MKRQETDRKELAQARIIAEALAAQSSTKVNPRQIVKALCLSIFVLIEFTAFSQVKSKDYSINCVFIVNDQLINYSSVRIYKYTMQSVDTLRGIYIPGEILFSEDEYLAFQKIESDSVKLELVTWLHEGGKVINGFYNEIRLERFFLFENNSFFIDRWYRAFIIEEMRIKKYRKRWGFNCREGFAITYINPQTMVPDFRYVPCYKGTKYENPDNN